MLGNGVSWKYFKSTIGTEHPSYGPGTHYREFSGEEVSMLYPQICRF